MRLVRNPMEMPSCLANFLLAHALAASPEECFWGGAPPGDWPNWQVPDLGANPAGIFPLLPACVGKVPLARQVVDRMRGPTPATFVRPFATSCGPAPLRPSVFADGSVENNHIPWAAYAGAGVWEPARDFDGMPPTEGEENFSHSSNNALESASGWPWPAAPRTPPELNLSHCF